MKTLMDQVRANPRVYRQAHSASEAVLKDTIAAAVAGVLAFFPLRRAY